MKVYWGIWGTAPLILILGTRWMWVVRFTAGCFSPGRWALLSKRNLGRTASLYVLEKSLVHAGNQTAPPRSCNPFPGHYIDRVISVGVFQNNFPLHLTLQRRATSVAATSRSFRTRFAKAESRFTLQGARLWLQPSSWQNVPPLSDRALQIVVIGFNFSWKNCKTASVAVKCERKLH